MSIAVISVVLIRHHRSYKTRKQDSKRVPALDGMPPAKEGEPLLSIEKHGDACLVYDLRFPPQILLQQRGVDLTPLCGNNES